MSMCRANRDVIGLDAICFFQSPDHFVPEIARYAAVVHRDEDSWPVQVAADRQRRGPNPLGDPFGFGFEGRINSEPDGVIWSDVYFGNTHELLFTRRQGDQRQANRADEPGAD